MQVAENKKFNMWDTNGRRSDVINAISIYLGILDELDTQMPGEGWKAYPASLKQYAFYKKAIAASPEIFKDHKNFDNFEERLNSYRNAFINRDNDFLNNTFPDFKESLDTDIEQRARHYTSNLVKLGLITGDRQITPAGKEFLSGITTRDEIEKLLPLSDLNIVLLRQIMKLRIFTKFTKDTTEGHFYSPFFMAIWLLLNNDSLERDVFKDIVLNTSPYTYIDYKNIESMNISRNETVTIPREFQVDFLLNESVFNQFITTSKETDKYSTIYYKFYSVSKRFFEDMTEQHYNEWLNIVFSEDNYSIKKAFLKNSPLKYGTRSHPYKLDKFKTVNRNSEWLNHNISFNATFYKQYTLSKSVELTKEYSDTLLRLFTATGLFNFSTALPELLYDDILKVIFSHIDFDEYIFGDISAWKYSKYEGDTESNYFGSHTTIVEILNLLEEDVSQIKDEISSVLGSPDIRSTLYNVKRDRMAEHVIEKYPKDKIVELLGYVSNRKNDDTIKKYVDSGADVPTIYEYLITIAWYYISGQDFSILDSLNLELNGEFEPMRHASGGQGDIEVSYNNKIVMLEVTLMNKAAQKRGEWEPVLRHSINLKAENEDKETTTLFIADELDNNSINIWRAVASVPLEATSSDKETSNVYIMPFTNAEIIDFLERNVNGRDIISSVRDSFESMDVSFDKNWRKKILENIG